MRIISVVSGKGGVGKTTTAINLAVYLNSIGQNVLLVDANTSTPDVGLSLGAPVVPISLQHVLLGKNQPEDAVYTHRSGTKVMPSSLSLSADIKNLSKVTGKLKNNFDFIIIDSAAGLGEDVIASIKAADECLIVTNAELPAITGAMKTIKLAEKMNKKILGILVTRRTKNSISLKNINSMLEHPVIGIIPEDSRVKDALAERDTLLNFPRSNASKGYKKLAMKIADAEEDNEKNIFAKAFDAVKNFKVSIKFG